jgi:hypothetical protein
MILRDLVYDLRPCDKAQMAKCCSYFLMSLQYKMLYL